MTNWAHKCVCGHTAASHSGAKNACEANVVTNAHRNSNGLIEGTHFRCSCNKFQPHK